MNRAPSWSMWITAVAACAPVVLGATPRATRAEGLLPGGIVHTFRCREDTMVTATLTFGDASEDVQVGVADTSFTLVGVVRATWEGGPDDGLEWYFSDSDSQSVSENAILFHGFYRPGIGGVFFPAELDGPPTESNPRIWVPAAVDLAAGYTWSWTGRWPFDEYAEVHTLDHEAAPDTIDVPYRDGAATWRLRLQTPPASLGIRSKDGTLLDAMGRVLSSGRLRACGTPDSSEPRWHAQVNSGRNRWTILVRDAFYELVALKDENGDDVVPVVVESFGGWKRLFHRP